MPIAVGAPCRLGWLVATLGVRQYGLAGRRWLVGLSATMRGSCPVLQQKNRELDHSLTCTTTQRPLLSLTVVSLTELTVEYRVIHTHTVKPARIKSPCELKGWFWSGSVPKAIGDAQNSFHCGGGAIKRGSNQLLFNPFMKSRMKPFC